VNHIGLTTEGISWCESINAQSLSWPALRELLKSKYPETLQSFTALQQVEESRISDIRLARKAGGFAFEFWCTGGDIHDIDSLLAHFSTLLESTYEFQEDANDHNLQIRSRVLDKVYRNASAAAQTNTTSDIDVWRLTLRERKKLLQIWQEEINPQTILDRTAEIHRRHQAAVRARSKVIHDLEARCLTQRKFYGTPSQAWADLASRRHHRIDYNCLCHALAYIRAVEATSCLVRRSRRGYGSRDIMHPIPISRACNFHRRSVTTKVSSQPYDATLQDADLLTQTPSERTCAFTGD